MTEAMVAEYENWWKTYSEATTEDWIMWCVGSRRATVWLATLRDVRRIDEATGLPCGRQDQEPGHRAVE